MAEPLNFEEALGRLEEIVHQLEAGDLSLDDALRAFEDGISMIKLCGQRLRAAEKKTERLTKSVQEMMEPQGSENS